MIAPLLDRFFKADEAGSFVLMDALRQISAGFIPQERLGDVIRRLAELSESESTQTALIAMLCLERIRTDIPETETEILGALPSAFVYSGEYREVLAFAMARLKGEPCSVGSAEASRIYLCRSTRPSATANCA